MARSGTVDPASRRSTRPGAVRRLAAWGSRAAYWRTAGPKTSSRRAVGPPSSRPRETFHNPRATVDFPRLPERAGNLENCSARVNPKVSNGALATRPRVRPPPQPRVRGRSGSNFRDRVSCPCVFPLKPTHVEIYVFRRRPRTELLLLRRSRGRTLPGIWQPVTGRVRAGERPERAAAREVREETGLSPRRWWALETLVIYLDPRSGRLVALPVFAAEIGAGERICLSVEHDRFEFVTPSRARRRVLWEAQRTAIAALGRQIFAGGRLAAALEITATARSPRIRPPRRRTTLQRRRRAPVPRRPRAPVPRRRHR